MNDVTLYLMRGNYLSALVSWIGYVCVCVCACACVCAHMCDHPKWWVRDHVLSEELDNQVLSHRVGSLLLLDVFSDAY